MIQAMMYGMFCDLYVSLNQGDGVAIERVHMMAQVWAKCY